MAIKVDYIACKHPWRKSFVKLGDELEARSVKPCYYVTSYRDVYEDLRALYNGLKRNAKEGRALLRGLLKHPLNHESRARKVNKRARTKLLVMDIDGTLLTNDPAEYVRTYVGLPSTDMIAVYTSSYGIKAGLRCLIIIELAEEVPFKDLKTAIWGLQLRSPELADEIMLDASQQALQPVLDPSSSTPSQLFTIAPPQFAPSSLDPFRDDPDGRYLFIEGDRRTLPVSEVTQFDEAEVADMRAKLLTQRRAEAGVHANSSPSRTSVRTDPSTGIEWTFVEDPTPAVVTSIKDCGDFVRLNLNGGDSEAYWHPKGSRKYLYSFKGNLMYPMQKILPEYYQSLVAAAQEEKRDKAQEAKAALEAGKDIVLVALDRRTEQYLCGLLNASSTWEDIEAYTKMTSVKSWLATHALDAPFEDYPPVYNVIFEPNEPFLDPVTRTINRYTPPQEPTELPTEATLGNIHPAFLKLVRHVLAGDEEMVETFLDWVAFLYQRRIAPHSAWLLHGTQGTGKDLTMSIVRRILGPRYCVNLMPHMLADNFNGWIEDANLVYVNEIDSRAFKGNNLSARLNDYITAERISIRRMRADSYEVTNRAGYVFSSNRMDAVELPPNDRRLHVPPRQETPLLAVMTNTEIDDLVNLSDSDILELRGWMRVRRYDEQRLRRPGLTEAKKILADASQPAATRLSGQLRSGLWLDVVEHIEPYEAVFSDYGRPMLASELRDFFAVFAQVCQNERSRRIAVTLTELRAIYAAACDRRVADMAPSKFRQYLMHNAMLEADAVTPTKRLGKSVRGVSMPLPPPEQRAEVLERIEAAGYGSSSSTTAAMRVVK